jgi:UDPglucose 6-dehydrogenase
MVGRAVLCAMSYAHETIGFDPYDEKYKNTWDEILRCNLVFVCVPTPTRDGKIDAGILCETVRKLNSANFSGTICVKCTVTPDILIDFNAINIVHNPEFLTARAAFQDFCNQKTVLISGDVVHRFHVRRAYVEVFPSIRFIESDSYKETCLAKYMSNCFAASKVSWMNEFADVCDAMMTNYENVRKMCVSQGIVSDNHTRVPGPDGKRGYGGACFPKDMAAFSQFLRSKGISHSAISSAMDTNEFHRHFDLNCREID